MDLICTHGDNFFTKVIEVVKTAPAFTLNEPPEHFPKTLVFDLFITVENNDISTKVATKICAESAGTAVCVIHSVGGELESWMVTG